MGRHEAIDPLIEALLDPTRHAENVAAVELVETHISWVLLTGTIALKIKKPVKLPFLDFSSLEARRHYCEEELRLNRRLAPDLYLDVVPIGGTRSNPVLGGEPAIEFAVRMREFPADDRLDQRIARGAVSSDDIVRLAELIGEFHDRLPSAPADSSLGSPAAVLALVEKNLNEAAAVIPDALGPDSIVTRYIHDSRRTREPALATRKMDGAIKEGHGDLHLENLIYWRDGILPFDALEFDPALRWLDVVDEAAFVVMDLMAHGSEQFAFTFLNRYLEVTGDYAGLSVLGYYLVHRALVRAKVRAIKVVQNEDRDAAARARPYLDLAARLVEPRRPLLVITHGLSGSGKTTWSQDLIATLPAVRLRSDIERKRLAGLAERARSHSPVGGGIYADAVSTATYSMLERHAETGLRGGLNVVVDAAFLNRGQREQFEQLAARVESDFVILDCWATADTLRRRVAARQAAEASVSEAGISVLEQQLESSEALSAEESCHAVRIDTESNPDRRDILERILAAR